jgi:hypothetical protein
MGQTGLIFTGRRLNFSVIADEKVTLSEDLHQAKQAADMEDNQPFIR